MVFDCITVTVGNFLLELLDSVIDKFDDLSRLQANHVIVVTAVGEFENRYPAFEVVPVHQASALELRKHPVDRGQAEFVTPVEQRPVNAFGAQVTLLAGFKHLENLQAGRRYLEPRIA